MSSVKSPVTPDSTLLCSIQPNPNKLAPQTVLSAGCKPAMIKTYTKCLTFLTIIITMKRLTSHPIHASILYPKQLHLKHVLTSCPACQSASLRVSILPPEQLHRRRCTCVDCGTTWDFRDKIPIRYDQQPLSD